MALLNLLKATDSPFQGPIETLAQSDSLEISSRAEAQRWLRKAEFAAKTLCKRISPVTAIPTLFQAINDCYYGNSREELIRFGPALKIALTLIAGNVYERSAGANQSSLFYLNEAVLSAALLNQLRAINVMFEIFGEEGDFVVFGSSGTRTSSDHMRVVRNQFWKTFQKRGANHRTLTDTISAIWEQLDVAFESVENILKGQSPKHQAAFRDSIFGEIPENASREFWLGLSARIKLAIASAQFSNPARQASDGISLLTVDPDATDQQILSETLWDETWYVSRAQQMSDNMVVERPLIKATPSENLYVTSFLAVGDSLNWFVEASVLPYGGEGGVRLPDVISQRFVSIPFENSVNELFRKYGFVAGKVSDKGVWFTQDANVQISHALKKIPGEVDCLAYHQSMGLVFVTECKVLGYPFSVSRMRNILFKIGQADSEGFFSKLNDKTRWIEESGFFYPLDGDRFLSILMLDRKLPGMTDNERALAFDLEMLEDFLKELSDQD